MKRKTLTGIFIFLIALLASAQTSSTPKLFIGIVVDQMREDFLFRFYDQYGEDGFKRLLREGAVCRNVHFNYTPTITAVGHASIYSGTTPKYHGIIGNKWYDRDLRKIVYCVTDSSEQKVGNETASVGVSPRNLLSTNICDELKISTVKKAKVISISTKDRASVLPAGHMADGVFYFDLNTGNYVSSTFYMDELPEWLVKFNNEKRAYKYLEEPWDLLLPPESYPRSLDDDSPYEALMIGKKKPTFPYNLKELAPLDSPYFEVFNRSPYGNSLLTDLAIEVLNSADIGQDEYTDMLAMSYSSTDAVGHIFGPLSKEINDTYLRLDQDIARLLKALDENIGKGNYTLFLTADHGVGEIPQYLIDNKIPAGIVYDSVLLKKVNDFMNSEYRPGNWINAYRNDQFYLNHNLIERKQLKLTEVEDKLASFLDRQEGIAETYTATQLKDQEYTEYFISKLQRGFNHRLSGNVRFILKPGWYTEIDYAATHNTCYNYDSHVPLIFYGKGIKPGTSYEYHEITDIAPTVSTLLKIKIPNAATGKVIPEVLK